MIPSNKRAGVAFLERNTEIGLAWTVLQILTHLGEGFGRC